MTDKHLQNKLIKYTMKTEKRKYTKRVQTEPIKEPVTEPIKEPVTEPIKEPVTQQNNVENDKSFLDKISQFEFKSNDNNQQQNISNINPDTGKRKYNKKQVEIQNNLSIPPVENVNQIISGYLFLIILDFVFPTLITFIHNKFICDEKDLKNTNKKIKSTDLKMSKKEIEELQPVADEVVKKLMININPIWVLLIGMGGIYFGNYMALTD